MANYQNETIELHKLLLDPNNYRFHDDRDFVAAEANRFHEGSVQNRAYSRLREPSLLQLKNSILKNGFLPTERIVVRPYEFDGQFHVVVEGNRRVAALRWINEDHQAGVATPQEVLDVMTAVPVLTVTPDPTDLALFESLMGIRHVSGIKQWGGYQRAELVANLRDTHALESNEIAERLAMTVQEVNRRYRAFKALQQMQSDDEFGMYARPEMYPLFHEAVALPVVREWLGWNDQQFKFTNADTLSQFYRLTTPSEDVDDGAGEAKLKTYQEVRDLREILGNAEAKQVLLDDTRTFVEALAIANRGKLKESWKTQIAEAIDSLQSIGVFDLQVFTEDDLALVGHLRDSINQLLAAHEKLKS